MSTSINHRVAPPAHIEEEFNTLLNKTFSEEPQWLIAKRKEAFDKFVQAGIPSRKNEQYKYTDVKNIFAGKFTSLHEEIEKIAYKESETDRKSIKLIFINGWLYKEKSQTTNLPKGVTISNLAKDGISKHTDVLKNHLFSNGDVFANLNSALWTEGSFINITDNIQVDKTIEIINIVTGSKEILANPKHLFVIGKNASVAIIEKNIAIEVSAPIIMNSHTDVFVEENASVQLYRLQWDCKNVSQISSIHVFQKQRSHFDTNVFSMGNQFVRNNLVIEQNGDNCESHLNGLFITKDHEFVDNHTEIQHNKLNGQSNQIYKGILDEKSVGVFNGRVYVKRDAQKTNAYQSSKNILLSDDASINTKPELEIYADDVKCSHGSSTGKIDEEALFYLRSRGLGEVSARRLLLHAFASDVLATVRNEEFKNELTELVEKSLND